MAASWLVLALRVDSKAAVDLAKAIFPGPVGTIGRLYGRQVAMAIGKLFGAAAAGQLASNLFASVIDDAGTKDAGNIACVQANAAGDTITFTWGGQTVVLTEGATGESGFARGADNTACALALATCINAHSVLKALFTAAPSVGNCGITSKVPTAVVRGIVLSTNDGTAFSFTQLTTSTVGGAQWFLQHFQLNRTP